MRHGTRHGDFERRREAGRDGEPHGKAEPWGSSTTLTATADEGDGAGPVGTAAGVPNGAMCGPPSCWC